MKFIKCLVFQDCIVINFVFWQLVTLCTGVGGVGKGGVFMMGGEIGEIMRIDSLVCMSEFGMLCKCWKVHAPLVVLS